MFKLMGKKIITSLRSKMCLSGPMISVLEYGISDGKERMALIELQ